MARDAIVSVLRIAKCFASARENELGRNLSFRAPLLQLRINKRLLGYYTQFTDFESFTDCVQNNEFLYTSPTSSSSADRVTCSDLTH